MVGRGGDFGSVRERHRDVVLSGNRAHDRKPEARSFDARSEHPIEGIEDARAFGLGDARARVGNAQHGMRRDFLVFRRGRAFERQVDRDTAVFGRVANRVFEQIAQHPVERLGGHRGGRETAVAFDLVEPCHFKIDPLLFHFVPEGFDGETHGFVKGRTQRLRVRQRGRGIGRCVRRTRSVGRRLSTLRGLNLRAFQSQELIHHPYEPLGRGRKALNLGPGFRGERPYGFGFGESLDPKEKRSEGRTQFVRRVRHEARLALAKFRDAREQPVEASGHREHFRGEPLRLKGGKVVRAAGVQGPRRRLDGKERPVKEKPREKRDHNARRNDRKYHPERGDRRVFEKFARTLRDRDVSAAAQCSDVHAVVDAVNRKGLQSRSNVDAKDDGNARPAVVERVNENGGARRDPRRGVVAFHFIDVFKIVVVH